MFVLTATVTVLIIFNRNHFYPILLNSLLSLYITLPLYIYNLFGVDKKYFKYIPILVIIEAIFENILFLKGYYNLIFISRIVFYFILLIPLFISKRKKHEKGTLEWNIQNMTIKTAFIIIAFMAMLAPLQNFFFMKPYVSSLYWAVFTFAYQIPGLLYCKNRLFSSKKVPKKDSLSILSKREKEVSLAICEGYKYEEIAQKLFVSLSAIKKHSYNIYRKLGIKNNRELLHIYMEAQKRDII